MQNKPISRKNDIVVQELEGELLIYDLNSNKAFCLNETSALVFQLCDGHQSISELTGQLSKKLNTPVSEDMVMLALDSLQKEKLLEEDVKIEIDFGGLSRRQLMRKVGLASLVTLPMITSIIAPRAVFAQSGAPAMLGAACTSTPDCAIGVCTTNTMLCCAPGSDPFAANSIGLLCGFCPPLASLCCSGMITDLGPGPCGGAGNGCVCNNS